MISENAWLDASVVQMEELAEESTKWDVLLRESGEENIIALLGSGSIPEAQALLIITDHLKARS